MIIEEDNLSVAWGRAFLEVFRVPGGEIVPLEVVIKDLDNAEPTEILDVRNALDDALRANTKGLSCLTVANTIFPFSLWNPKKDRNELYDRYLGMLPRILKRRANQHGVYFQRLISFGYDRKKQSSRNQLSFVNEKKEVNQLEKILETWENGNHRRTALQATIFDPYNDYSPSNRRRGFPCLQQVAFSKIGEKDLQVTGFYATQYMFERAYGNYLGLCRLGRFMAHEMGLELSRVICIATPAKLDRPKKDLKELADKVEAALDRTKPDDEEGNHA